MPESIRLPACVVLLHGYTDSGNLVLGVDNMVMVACSKCESWLKQQMYDLYCYKIKFISAV